MPDRKNNKKKIRKNVYNLLVFPHQNYLANDFIVHNKGCFLLDTFILKSDGSSVKISQLKKGDKVFSFDKNGNLKTSKVLSIIKLKTNEYFEIKTKNISVYATKEHPF